MKKILLGVAIAFSSMTAPAVFAHDQTQDHHPGNLFEINRAAYALADAGEYMANICAYGSSLGYAANNVHQTASRLYHLTTGYRPYADEIKDHNDGDLPLDVVYAARDVDSAFYNLQSQYNRYPYLDYRIQQAYNTVGSRYQSLRWALQNAFANPE